MNFSIKVLAQCWALSKYSLNVSGDTDLGEKPPGAGGEIKTNTVTAITDLRVK